MQKQPQVMYYMEHMTIFTDASPTILKIKIYKFLKNRYVYMSKKKSSFFFAQNLDRNVSIHHDSVCAIHIKTSRISTAILPWEVVKLWIFYGYLSSTQTCLIHVARMTGLVARLIPIALCHAIDATINITVCVIVY